jgi:predicted permease
MKRNLLKIGMIAVVAIVAFLNVNVALKGEKNMLADVTLGNINYLAYAEDNGSTKPKEGPLQYMTVQCKITTYHSNTSGGNSNSSNNNNTSKATQWQAYASASTSTPLWSGQVGAGGGQNNTANDSNSRTSSSSSSQSSSASITATFTATMKLCERRTTASCREFNPCKAYATSMGAM